MKKKNILITLVVLLVIVLFLFLSKKSKNVTMECSNTMTMIGSDAEVLYVFHGVNGIATEQYLYVKLFITDENLINDYKNIMKDNKECNSIKVNSDSISYDCYYDLVNEHYYEDLENSDGELLLDALKKDFENDNYVCKYK